MVKCNVCGGTYEPIQRDGSQYFHACPPLSEAEIRDGLAKKTLTLPAADQKRIDDAGKLLDANDTADAAAARVDQVVKTLIVERANKRDENVAGLGAPGQPAPQKAPGAGVTKL